jgi:GntR family transcriptional regulator
LADPVARFCYTDGQTAEWRAIVVILVLDQDAEEPLYVQIYRQVTAAVADGSLGVGDTLPGTRRLAHDLGINYHTVHRAYELLQLRGVIAMAPRGKAVIREPDRLGPSDEWIAVWEADLRNRFQEALALGLSSGEILRRARALLEGVPAGTEA